MSENNETDEDNTQQEFFIRFGSHEYVIQANVDENCQKLKVAIAKETGVLVKDQNLLYNGLGIAFDDDKSLRYYGCQAGGSFFTLTEKK